MTETNYLREHIMKAAQLWLPLGRNDENLKDIYWHASKVSELIGLHLPINLPMKEIGIAFVECVENNFIKSSLIRRCASQELAKRGEQLMECLRKSNLLSIGPAEAYVIALYTWHGCINMAKLLRKATSSGELYTVEMRWEGYNWLQQCWCDEDNRGNPWVKYGVSLARLLEKRRGNPLIEDWVPRESPYWDC